MKNNGQVLIATIILIVLVAIIIFTITIFLNQMVSLNIARNNMAKAVYAAQAGIYKAVVDYRNTGLITAETDTQIDTNTYYTIGGAGTFFLPDFSNPTIIASRKIKDVSITNLSGVDDLTITHMQISWTPDGGENLEEIDLGRGTAEWSGTAQSGTNIDIIDYTISANTTENDIWIDWEVGTDITAMTITGLLTLSDGSVVEFNFLEDGKGTDNAFVITSTGKFTGESTWKRTIKAGYDITTDEITFWKESQTHL